VRVLAAIASVFHGGQFFGAGPGDGEQECGFGYCFDVVTDGAGKREEAADGEVVRLALDGDTDLAFEDLNGDGAVGVVFLHAGAGFHCNEDDSEVVLLEEGSGVVAGLPWLLLLGAGDLLVQVELRHLVDHGSVL
jgi:hypothetical protein